MSTSPLQLQDHKIILEFLQVEQVNNAPAPREEKTIKFSNMCI